MDARLATLMEVPVFWTALALASVLALAARAAAWRQAFASGALHRFFGGALALALLWIARADPGQGLPLQLVGVPLLTLMLGPALAMWSAALAATILASVFHQSASVAIWNALFLGAVPALATDLGRRAVAQWLPAHPFVYILGNGFFITGLAAAAAQLCAAALLLATGSGTGSSLLAQYAPFILLIGFGEATLSGMLLTLMVVYLPNWVATFEDRHYLQRPS
jgi:uncharacterized membrane protein